MKYEHIPVDGQMIPYLQMGKGPALLFLHGFGVSPDAYAPLLRLLAKKHTVIAPSFYGTPLQSPPQTAAECVSMTKRFCDAIGLRKFVVVGHSTGGLVALRMRQQAVALNPALPVSYGVAGFAMRGVWKCVRAIAGTSGWSGMKYGISRLSPFNLNLWRSPRAAKALVSSLTKISHEGKNTLIIYGTADEYFRLPRDLRARQLQGLAHDWPLFYPEQAAKEIEKALKSRKACG